MRGGKKEMPHVYKPVYDAARNGWYIDELDPDELKIMGKGNPANPENDLVTLYKPGFGHYGPVYRNYFFLFKSAAQDYIDKTPARKFTLQKIQSFLADQRRKEAEKV
jgi:hypothetical protein